VSSAVKDHRQNRKMELAREFNCPAMSTDSRRACRLPVQGGPGHEAVQRPGEPVTADWSMTRTTTARFLPLGCGLAMCGGREFEEPWGQQHRRMHQQITPFSQARAQPGKRLPPTVMESRPFWPSWASYDVHHHSAARSMRMVSRCATTSSRCMTSTYL
jgi:hypothetical protein